MIRNLPSTSYLTMRGCSFVAISRFMTLVNLAPDIVEGIMDDPPRLDIPVKKIFSHRLPADWNEQRKFLGLPVKDYAAG